MSTSDKLAATVGAKTATTTTAPAVQKPKTLAGQILDASFKKQLALALPKHITADRMARIAVTELRKNPDLLACNPASFMGSVMQSAQLGLEPGSALGQAYLVPFNSKNGKQCQLILGYRGMIDLARRSGQIVSISAFAVHQGDDFHYELGLHPDIHHIPSPDADRINRPITFVYAVANLKDGGVQFEVMSRPEVDKIKAEAKSKNVWQNHFEAMALKTVIRRLFKYLPVSIEALQAANLDSKREAGIEIKPEDLVTPENVREEDFIDAEVVEDTKPQANEDGEILEPVPENTN